MKIPFTSFSLTRSVSPTPATAAVTLADPKPGEKTGTQAKPDNPIDEAMGVGSGFQGFNPPEPGTYEVYRRLCKKLPTVALRFGKLQGTLTNNVWKYKKLDDSVPDERVQRIKDWFAPMRYQIITDALWALKFGFAPFEEVWVRSKNTLMPTLKPLRVEYTKFTTKNGSVYGMVNKVPGKDDVYLGPESCFSFTLGGEAGDPYGESLVENIREVGSEAYQIRRKVSRYMNKISGVLGQIHYPPGTSKDSAGADRPNFELAKGMASSASNGQWLLMPNHFAAYIAKGAETLSPAALEKALATAGKSSWVASFLDASGTDHSKGFDTILRYYDSLLVRGLMESERAILEGQHGTKADAGEHKDAGILFASMVDGELARQLNSGVVDDALEFNDGPDARGSVYIEPGALQDDAKDAKLKTVLAFVNNPATVDGMAQKYDADANMEDIGLKVRDEARGPLEVSIMLAPPTKPPNPNDEGGDDGED